MEIIKELGSNVESENRECSYVVVNNNNNNKRLSKENKKGKMQKENNTFAFDK